MIKYTKHFLLKMEDFFKKADYILRYEKGNFHSGYCMVENKNIIIVNKFFETEARINTLIEILPKLLIPEDNLAPEDIKFYKSILDVKSEIE